MKFNKSSLLSSLATAGIVLGAIAPVVANAANTIPVPNNNGQIHAFNDDGTVTKLTKNDKDAYLSETGNSYATNLDPNQDTGTAQGVSDGYVRLVSGYLTLDDVPDFNFGTVAVGSLAHLQSNEGKIADDGNAQGVLQVTDSRSVTPETSADPNAKPPVAAAPGSQDGRGYTLGVKLGNFYQLDAGGARTATSFSGFTLHIPALGTAKDSQGKDIVNADPKTTASLFKIDVPSDNTTVKTLLSAEEGSSYGTTSVNLTKDAGITLDTDTNATKGAYDAPIYWILSANPSA